MTQAAGSAGEDFASVLRALGYRMDRRPPLPPKPEPVAVVETVSAETPPVEAAAEATSETPAGEAAAELPVSGDPAPSVALLPEVSLETAVEAPPAVAEAEGEPEAVAAPAEPAAEVPAEAAPQDEPVVEAAADTAVSGETASRRPFPPAKPWRADGAAAPKRRKPSWMIEVWRPGGRSEERRPPRHDRNRHRQGQHVRAQDGAQPAAAGEGGEAAPRQQHRRGRRHQDFRKPREGAPADAAAAPSAEGAPAQQARQDQGRPPRERFEGKGRDERRDKFQGDRNKGDRNKGGRDKGGRDFGGRDKGSRDKRDSGPSHRQWATSAAPRERDRPIDPNSPFAKLAALKEQLASRKE